MLGMMPVSNGKEHVGLWGTPQLEEKQTHKHRYKVVGDDYHNTGARKSVN